MKDKPDIIQLDTLTEREKKLIEELRKISFGQVSIYMQDGEPFRIEVIRESKKL